jgi:hypothetical protein
MAGMPLRRTGRELGEDAGPEFEGALSALEQAPPGVSRRVP